MRRGHIRAIAGACLAAVALSACGDTGEAATDVEPSAPAVTEVETTSPEPVEATDEPLEVPEPDLTIESEADVEKVVGEILEFRGWLFGHPDRADLVERIYWTECGCHAGLTAELEEFAEEGRRVVGKAPFDVVAVEVTSSTEGSRSITLTFRPPPAVLYGPDGTVVKEADEYFPEVTEDWLLAKNDSGAYRVLQTG